jgi:hypothetical protein
MKLEIYKPKKNKTLRASYRWHRFIGVLISLPVLLVAITGIALNHADSFDLNNTQISNSTILNQYGMVPDQPITSFEDSGVWASMLGKQIFLNGEKISSSPGKLIGFLSDDSIYHLLTSNELLLISAEENQLIDKLGSEALPTTSTGITKKDGAIFVSSPKGVLKLSDSKDSFTPADSFPFPAREQASLPKKFKDKILENFRGDGISLWRVVLDIHSGAFFGRLGVFLADLTALALILLTLTGLYNWWKTAGRGFCKKAWPPVCEKECEVADDCEHS